MPVLLGAVVAAGTVGVLAASAMFYQGLVRWNRSATVIVLGTCLTVTALADLRRRAQPLGHR